MIIISNNSYVCTCVYTYVSLELILEKIMRVDVVLHIWEGQREIVS
jgi:hypothetical protein